MSDKIFLDSNILVYCYTSSDLRKQSIARGLATKKNTCISTQVLNETTNVLNKKYGINWNVLEDLITDFENNFFVQILTPNDVRKACRIADRYKFSFYDSMIISSAIECNCSILYSEDLQDSQMIGNNIKIVNPFL
jgi:predicted nucleic acid-binding protein